MLQVLMDISLNDSEIKPIDFNYYFPNFYLHKFVYNNSKIDLNAYYKSCTMIAYKSANNQRITENMEHWVFSNCVAYMDEFISAEHKNGENTEKQESPQQMMGGMMNQAKSMFKTPSLASMKK